MKGRGEEGKVREGEGREGKGREAKEGGGKGREWKGRASHQGYVYRPPPPSKQLIIDMQVEPRNPRHRALKITKC